MNTKPQYSRREANPLAWKDLTEQQKAAVTKIAGLLDQALHRKDERRSFSGAALARDRYAQLAFIDGDRGMGKTSVLLTIRDLVTTEELDKHVPDGGAGAARKTQAVRCTRNSRHGASALHGQPVGCHSGSDLGTL